MSRPDFGMHVVYHGDTALSCRYIAPGLTMYDLVQIFAKARDNFVNSEYAGNPSRWPTFAGVSAVTDAILDAIYPPHSVAAEIAALKHDIERSAAVSSELATENARLRAALCDIGKQQTTKEIEPHHEGDFEYGYDAIIKVARAALAGEKSDG